VPAGWAALAVGTYILVGAAGLPVFSGLHGGLGVLAGPTGGYLIGFLAGAVAGAAVRGPAGRVLRSTTAGDALAALVVIVLVYACGWVQLTLVTQMGAAAAFVAGVVPFIVPDAVKAAVAVGVAPAVRRAARL